MIQYVEAIEPMRIDADRITPHPRNPSSGSVEDVIHSIRANGCYRPIYASSTTGRILAGHTLYNALLSIGETRLPVQWIENLSADDELRIVLADNKVAELARRDDALVADIIDDIGTDGTGYTEQEILDMKAELASGFNGDADPDLDEENFDIAATCPNCGHTFTPEFA